MSEALKDLLHQQATSVAFRSPDVETIAHAGGRRIRRRRTATILAAVCTVVVVVVGGVVALRDVPGGPPPMPAGPWPSAAVMWSFGTTINVATETGTDTVEVGHEVRGFVRTATGFVVLDETDAVYSVTGVGVTRIGQMHDTQPNNTDQQRLVVNSRGTLVGWVDEAASPGSLVLRIYDARSGSSRDIPGGPVSEDGVNFFAMDDRTAYWRLPDGVHGVNVDTGDDRLILARADLPIPDEIFSFEIYSVENGVLAFSPNDDGTFFAGRSIENARELFDFSDIRATNGHTDPVRLSPTGAWLSFGRLEVTPLPGENLRIDRGVPMVFDTATGAQVTLSLPGDPVISQPNVWLDDTTLQVSSVAVDVDHQPLEPLSVTFYRCTLPAGTCEVAAEVGPPLPGFGAIPGGRWNGP